MSAQGASCFYLDSMKLRACVSIIYVSTIFISYVYIDNKKQGKITIISESKLTVVVRMAIKQIFLRFHGNRLNFSLIRHTAV